MRLQLKTKSNASKLTGAGPHKAAADRLPPFYFRNRGDWFLITNDWGSHTFLKKKDFGSFLEGTLSKDHPQWTDLLDKGFVREGMGFESLARRFLSKNSFLWQRGPSLHMVVTTLRCNQKCHYCHASVVDPSRKDFDMSLETAKRAVDFIFSTPNPVICIEFQGGEPLLNWPVVTFVTEYAQKMAQWKKRRLILSMVSNLSLLNDERLDYLLSRHVALCTSLDGPPLVHDQNRPFLGGGPSHDKAAANIKKIQERCRKAGERTYYLPSALMTTTRFSLAHGKEIVDAYLELGFKQIFLRALAPIGFAKRAWKDIGYAPEEFVEFYAKTLDYIIDLNLKGTEMVERLALVLLTKIIKREDPGYMDLRSPSGAALGALAYNFDGSIYAGDEGRMVAQEGDEMFRLGSVFENDWTQIVDNPTTKALAVASTLENQPMCSQCAYKPYCGVEPVYHYETQGSIRGHIPTSSWCARHMGIFDVLFDKLNDPRARKVFESWLEKDICMWQESEPGRMPANAV